MNTKQTLALLLVFAFALGSVSTVQAQADDFGSQVQFGDNDFIPTYNGVVAPTVAHFRYVDFGDTGNVQDDALYLNVDGGVIAEGVEKDDVRLTAFEGKAAGTFVGQQDTVETGATAVAPGNIGFRYADVDENGRYNDGDYVYLVGSAAAVTQIGATTSSAEWTVRLTDTEWGSAGTFVLGGDQDLVVYGASTSAFATATTGSAAAPGLTLALFNADRSTGGSATDISAATDGDRLYLNSNPTATATAADSRVALSSIRLAGDAGQFGSQVEFGDNDFVPDLTLLANLNVLRYEGGDDDAFTDDVIVVDVDGAIAIAAGADGAALEDDDIVLSNGGYGGRAAGELVDSADTLLIGKTGTIVSQAELTLRFADVNNNGRYDEGDYVFLIGDDAGTPTTLTATVTGPESYFALRLTETNGGAAGSFVRSGDQDLIDYGGALSVMPNNQFAFFDADLDGAFDEDDRGYFNLGGGLVDLYAIRLHGDTGEFGTQVSFGAVDFVPQMDIDGTIKIVRYEAGDDDAFTDDVIVLDSDNDGAGGIERDDLVLTSGTYGGRTMGEYIQAADTQLIGQGTNDIDVGLVYVDKNNNNRYDEGDWVYMREAAASNNLAATALGETVGTTFTLRLTDTDGGNAGTFVKSGDVDLTNWNSNAKDLDATISDVGIFDADLDGDISEGDRVYLTEGTGLVDLYAVRLVGNFEERTGPGTTPTEPTTPTDPTPTDPTPTDPTPTDPTPTDPTPTDPTPTDPTPTDPTPTDPTPTNPTPGFELIALVAALGAGLVLVRRRN